MIKNPRFGKLPPKIDYRTLNLSNYLKEDIPEPPEVVDLDGRVMTNLNQHNISVLFPMYDNDQIGNCTVAALAHGVTVYHGMVKQMHIPQLNSVVKTYYHLTGGSDTGLYLLDVVKFWRNNGLEDSKVFAYANVRKHNRVHVKQAITLFGGLMVGFQCQENVIDEFNAGGPWQKGTLINAGHAVYAVGYDQSGVELLTWGSIIRGTWEWWDWCVDECYALLPPEAVYPEFTPGFDFARLKRDLQEVASII